MGLLWGPKRALWELRDPHPVPRPPQARWPTRQSVQSVVNSNKVEDPRDALGDGFTSPPLPAPRPPNYSYYYNLHLFSSYFTFCYLRLPYVYRHAETGVGGFERPAATSADPEKRNCNTANLALRQNKHKLFTGFGYQLRFKCGLKQHALYTS